MAKDSIPYPAYKSSGIPWIGNVPEHWRMTRLKEAATIVAGSSPPSEIVSEFSGAFPFLQGNAEFGRMHPSPRLACETPPRWGRAGDILLSVRAPVGALNVADKDYGIGRGLCAVRTGQSLYRPFAYYTLGVANQELLRLSTGSTYGSVTVGIIGGLTIALPLVPEQRAIVHYLDYLDRLISLYVSAKRKLIALLEEERLAIINHAVTRGLNPTSRLRYSRVEWLGHVPEHWEVTALHHKYSQCLGKMLDSKRIRGDHLLPYLRNVDIKWDRINVDALPAMDIPPAEFDRYTVRPGDLLVCEGGEVGRSAIWRGELVNCGFQKALHRLRPKGSDLPRFMYYVLRAAFNASAFSDGHVSTIPHLTGDKLRAHRLPFPPLPEQTAIVEYLDNASASIDVAIARARRQMELVQEYRTRLIADVVTGKVDVRAAATRLPDENDEADPVFEDGLIVDNPDDATSDGAPPIPKEPMREREVTA